jgi:predicted nucleic-acid-binding protein
MIAVDANVVVRLLVGDDPEQAALARRLFESGPIFIPDTVVLETAWVLAFSYGLTSETIAAGLQRLFGLPNIHLRDAAEMALALGWHDHGLDFADALHLAQAARCTSMMTFDRRFAARGQEIGGLKVELVSGQL